MAVSNQVVKQDYVGNGVTTTFAIPFTYKKLDEIKVYLLDTAAGTSTLQFLSTNYTYDDVNAPTNIIMNVAPVAGKWLRVIRETPIVQDTEIENNGEFLEQEMETALDKLTLMMQELHSTMGSAILLNPVDTVINNILPKLVANGVLGSNGAGTAYVWRAASDFQGPQGIQGLKGDKGDKGDTGATGATGATGYGIFFGAGVPSNGTGNDGDVYINTVDYMLYYKVTGAWVAQGILKGPQGDTGIQGPQGMQGIQGLPGDDGVDGINGLDGSMIYANYGAPQNSLGKDQDLYIDRNPPTQYYQKLSGVWVMQGELQGLQGPPGVDGAIGPTAFGLFIENTDPVDSFGNDNDIWINNTTFDLFYKISGHWEVQGSLRPPGFPAAGTTGQYLAKASNTDYDTEWVDLPPTLPPGGTVNQILTKQSGTDGDADWEDAPITLPPQTGENGKFLTTNGSAASWATLPPSLPTGGTTAQFLRKASNGDGDATWQNATASDVGLGNVNNTSDANKPVSTAQQAALDLKLDQSVASDSVYATSGTFPAATQAMIPYSTGPVANSMARRTADQQLQALTLGDAAPGAAPEDLLNRSYIQGKYDWFKTGLVTTFSAGAMTISQVPKEIITAQGQSGGGTVMTIPNATVDKQELLLCGASDSATWILEPATNLLIGGAIEFFRGSTIHLMWNNQVSAWIVLGRNGV